MGKRIAIHRFNKPTDESNYLYDFQKVMLERLILSEIGKYNKINVKRIIKRLTDRNVNQLDTDIANGLLLACNVNAEFYILLQELIYNITGDYMPMDDFIQLLLTWFYVKYTKELKGRECNDLPFNRIYKGRSLINQIRFKKRFSKHFKNHVVSFQMI